MNPFCDKCRCELEWQECENCEEGYSYHDCGEDCCCCLNPENNVICDTCNGEGGWYYCYNCKKSIEVKNA